MNNENRKINKTIEAVFNSVNNHLFDQYGLSFMCARHLDGGDETSIGGDSVMSLLSASGEGINILCSIKMSCATAERVSLDRGCTTSAAQIRDICGELSNQLIGKFKNKMLGYGCQLMLGLPTCILGRDVLSHSLPDASIVERIYKSEIDEVVVTLYIVIKPALEILDVFDASLTGEVPDGALSFL